MKGIRIPMHLKEWLKDVYEVRYGRDHAFHNGIFIFKLGRTASSLSYRNHHVHCASTWNPF
jgi:hypothetical protein